MTKDSTLVAVDTAFLLKLTEQDKKGELFINIMTQMQRSPVMHRFIFDQELLGNATARHLVNDGIITLMDVTDFLTDDEDRQHYRRLFHQAYRGMNGCLLPNETDIFTYHRVKENLGEIHTALMAQHLHIDLMVSHDIGAKSYIENHMSSARHPLMVYNIGDVLVFLAACDRSVVKWQDVKGVAKRLFSGSYYDNIRDCWQADRSNDDVAKISQKDHEHMT